MDNSYILYAVLVTALVTAGLRFLPFIIFGSMKTVPKTVLSFSRILPCAIMGMLVVYCLRTTSFSSVRGFVPQLIAGITVVALYLFKRNTLLSILGGTACYMLLIRII